MESFHCNGCNSQRMFESLRWKLHNDMVEALQNTTQCYCRAAQKSPTCPFCKHCQDDYWSYEHYATLTDILGFYACQPNDRMDETKMATKLLAFYVGVEHKVPSSFLHQNLKIRWHYEEYLHAYRRCCRDCNAGLRLIHVGNSFDKFLKDIYNRVERL
ncbi:hypothetical protein FOZ60_000284 [Perkinsus olseni]|uniref:Uncharacterized protein n=1 Tax=Perkinsus olseni TaxID=32597 RepID=A0A7J6N2L2_PEROL|nr:hypothetical protein FOZ60_000284 [Perkinsus olseni]